MPGQYEFMDLLDELRARQAQLGIDPNSEQGVAQARQLYQVHQGNAGQGRGLTPVQPPPGSVGPPVPTGLSPQAGPAPSGLSGFESRITPNYPPGTETKPPDRGLGASGVARDGIDDTSIASMTPRKANIDWMQDQEKIEEKAFTVAGKIKLDKGKGKGKWVPFETMPNHFKNEFMQESGLEQPPAGWWTGDLDVQERQLINMMALNAAQARQYTHEPSGPARSAPRQMVAQTGSVEP